MANCCCSTECLGVNVCKLQTVSKRLTATTTNDNNNHTPTKKTIRYRQTQAQTKAPKLLISLNLALKIPAYSQDRSVSSFSVGDVPTRHPFFLVAACNPHSLGCITPHRRSYQGCVSRIFLSTGVLRATSLEVFF